MYRRGGEQLEVFLVHPGGPYWSKKNEGAWTLPKGEFEDGEEPLAAARREFYEETGFYADDPFLELGSIRQKSGKVVLAWAFEGDCNPEELKSNLCQIEWPPRTKRFVDIPEIDRGGWFSIPEAKERILPSQQPFLEALVRNIG
ncbi:MAG: hydrolase [Edaphobacter sp.]|nr:hydrolase [Edaphobacter sp.]